MIPTPDTPDTIQLTGPKGPVGCLGPADEFQRFETVGGIRVWFCGVLLDRPAEAFAAGLAESVCEGADFSSASQAIGRFAAVIFDGRTGRATVVTDRNGFQPLYRAHVDGRFWLSPSLDWLRRQCPTLARQDLGALGELLVFKFVLRDHTLLENVRRFSPASVTELGELEVLNDRAYWSPLHLMCSPRTSLADQLDELTDCFQRGIQSLFTSSDRQATVSLSGGLDSRVVLAALLNQSVDVLATTVGLEGGYDHRISKRLCEGMDIRHEFHAQDERFRASFLELMIECADRTDAMLLTDNTPQRWLVWQASAGAPRLKLHGAMGELARLRSLHLFPVDDRLRNSRRDQVAELLTERFCRMAEAITPLMHGDLREHVADRPVQTLRQCISDLLKTIEPMDVPAALALGEHMRNAGTYSFLVSSDRFDMWSPFLSPEFLDCLLRIAPTERLDSRLHIHMLRRLAPKLLAFPESGTGCKPGRAPWITAVPRFAARVSSRLGLASTKGHSDYAAWITQMKPPPEEVLLDKSIDLFDRSAIGVALGRARRGDARSAAILHRLLTVALWHRRSVN